MPVIRELVTKWVFRGDTAAVKRFDKAIAGAKKGAILATKAVAGIAVGAAAAGVGIAALVKKTAEADDAVGKMADRTGVAVEDLSALGFAAEQSGGDMDTLADGLKDLGIKAGEAFKDPKSSAAKFFKEIGVSVKDSEGNLKPMIDLFLGTAEGLSRVEGQANKAVIANGLLGGSWFKLLPMFKEGAAGLAKVAREGKDAGFTLKQKAAKNAADFGDALNKLRRTIGGVVDELVRRLTPTITRYLKIAQKWLIANKDIIKVKIVKFATDLWEALKRLREVVANIKWEDVEESLGKVVGALKEAIEWISKAENRASLLEDLKLALLALGSVAVLSSIGGLVKTLALLANPIGATILLAIAIAGLVKSMIDLKKARERLNKVRLVGLDLEGKGGPKLKLPTSKLEEKAPSFLQRNPKLGERPALAQPAPSQRAQSRNVAQTFNFDMPMSFAPGTTTQQANQLGADAARGAKRVWQRETIEDVQR